MAEAVKPEDSPVPAGDPQVDELAARRDATKPAQIPEREWRRQRIAHGHMVIIRSHFKSIYLIPMAVLSLVAGVGVSLGNESETAIRTWGLLWTFAFMFYMNIFIFEWNRPATVILILSLVAIVAVGFAISTPEWNFFEKIWRGIRNLNLQLGEQTFFFFGLFFGICALVSFIKTRLNYVVMEHNELQVYRNALVGDRERISMMTPRVEVRVTDMIEYLHPFYRAGMIIIHGPNKTLVLDNVLNIRRIERITDKLGSTLAVSVQKES